MAADSEAGARREQRARASATQDGRGVQNEKRSAYSWPRRAIQSGLAFCAAPGEQGLCSGPIARNEACLHVEEYALIQRKAALLATLAALATAGAAHAGPYANDLAKCLVESTTTGGRAALVNWMFSASGMEKHVDESTLRAQMPPA
jgi:hypothetical protein